MYKKLLLLFLVGIMAAPSVLADRRKYVWTYQAITVPKDMAELEFYQTTKIDDTYSWEYRIELENGITDNFDLAVYQIFAQEESESFKWNAFQIRARYRPVARGEFFMDPILYFEYKRKLDGDLKNKLEGKLILGKDFGKTNLSLNGLYEYKYGVDDAINEFGFDIGISYSPSFKLSLGLESTTRYEILKGKENETGSYFGPTVSFASGSFFYTVGYATGITDDSNHARVRFLMGVSL